MLFYFRLHRLPRRFRYPADGVCLVRRSCPVAHHYRSVVTEMLVIGDSYAARLRDRPPLPFITAAGVRGGCVTVDNFRRWAVRVAAQCRPGAVMVMAGGNDVATRTCSTQAWLQNMAEMALGLIAAGATRVLIMPIPPRHSFRDAAMSARLYRRRRWVANRLLRRRFRGPQISALGFTYPPDFLAADGVHPSAAGWRALETLLRSVVEKSREERGDVIVNVPRQ
jgi:lysophospholipase L1-like esterase